MDFNPTFSLTTAGAERLHPGTTPIQGSPGSRINHGIACRQIGASIGRALGTPCITNVWIPDGSKDSPIDRAGPRHRLASALDAVFAEPIDPRFNRDAVEGKLFGLGSESYVAGSHEFYFGYAVSRNKLLCLDTGHYHPTEIVSDKISAVLLYLDKILLHVSRGVRWDSDHVVILSDELVAIAQELVRGDFLGRVHIGLDFFDASINRIAAWVIGARGVIKALLLALLEPAQMLRRLEAEGDLTARLAILEELKTLPAGAVWDHYCRTQGVPVGADWLPEVKAYEPRRAVETRLSEIDQRRGIQHLSTLLKLTSISKSFAGVDALKRVSFDLSAGEVHALVGENGAGKSTLIKVITGAHLPDQGTIEIQGQPVENLDPLKSRELGVAAIYQQPALFPDLTVAENIAIGLEGKTAWRRVRWKARRARARALLERLGAAIDPDSEVRRLSMPEQQLVEIARALGADARILIMDEPTASLSDREVERLYRVIAELKAHGAGIIYISHRLEELPRVADRVTEAPATVQLVRRTRADGGGHSRRA